jgi:hypothetical protein
MLYGLPPTNVKETVKEMKRIFVDQEKMLEKTEMIIPPKKTTPMRVPQPIGLAATRAPHFGHVSALELTSAPHSLHLMSAIVVISLCN